MDDADRANLEEERRWVELERRLARQGQVHPRLHCQDCGETLAPHRQVYALCLHCAERAESRMKLWGKW